MSSYYAALCFTSSQERCANIKFQKQSRQADAMKYMTSRGLALLVLEECGLSRTNTSLPEEFQL